MLRVGERAQDLECPGDPGLVQADEAAPRHLRGRAVPAKARDAEVEADFPTRSRGVQRRREKRRARDVVARIQRDAAEQVAPVLRQLLDERVPLQLESVVRLVHLDLAGKAAAEDQGSSDPFLVQIREQPPRRVGSDARVARDDEADVVADAARCERPEQRSSAVPLARLGQDEAQSGFVPALGKRPHDAVPLLRQTHRRSID